jgi:hypothetical protein
MICQALRAAAGTSAVSRRVMSSGQSWSTAGTTDRSADELAELGYLRPGCPWGASPTTAAPRRHTQGTGRRRAALRRSRAGGGFQWRALLEVDAGAGERCTCLEKLNASGEVPDKRLNVAAGPVPSGHPVRWLGQAGRTWRAVPAGLVTAPAGPRWPQAAPPARAALTYRPWSIRRSSVLRDLADRIAKHLEYRKVVEAA